MMSRAKARVVVRWRRRLASTCQSPSGVERSSEAPCTPPCSAASQRRRGTCPHRDRGASSTSINAWSRERATGKISCFPPPLVCIRTVLRSRGFPYFDVSSAHDRRLDLDAYAGPASSFGARLVRCFSGAAGALNWNVEPSRHIACMITESLRATATQARL